MTQGGPMEAARPPALRRLLAGVRGRLLMLVGAAMVPVIGIAGAQAWHDYEQDLASARKVAQTLQEQAVAYHRAEFDLVEEMLLSLTTDVAELPPEACDAGLRAAQALFPRRLADVWIVDREGRMRCGARPAAQSARPGADLPPPQAEGRLTLDRFATDAAPGNAVVPAVMPILADDGRPRAAIGAAIRLVHAVPIDTAPPRAGHHQAWLIDRNGTTLALTAASEADLPRTGPPGDGVELFEGAARSGAAQAWSIGTVRPGLRLMVGVPMDGARSDARAALQSRLVEIVGFVLACLGAVMLGVELSVARPLRRLAAQVRGWSPRAPYAAVQDGHEPREMRELDSALLAASGAIAQRDIALRAALKQRDLAIEEINHRVHNNLQIVASLISMQAENSRQVEVKADLVLTHNRVRALATLYRHLSRASRQGRIRLRPFIEELCQQLGDHAGVARRGQVRMAVEVEDLELDADQADSLTLLVTEAVTNAVQHAFPEGNSGTITVSLRRDGESAALVVRDDGVGMPQEADHAEALGLNLIRGFASHLGGSAVISGDDGTRISVTFPLRRA